MHILEHQVLLVYSVRVCVCVRMRRNNRVRFFALVDSKQLLWKYRARRAVTKTADADAGLEVLCDCLGALFGPRTIK